MYMELILNNHVEHAKNLLEQFGPEQEEFYQDDIKKFSQITNKSQINKDDLAETFK